MSKYLIEATFLTVDLGGIFNKPKADTQNTMPEDTTTATSDTQKQNGQKQTAQEPAATKETGTTKVSMAGLAKVLKTKEDVKFVLQTVGADYINPDAKSILAGFNYKGDINKRIAICAQISTIPPAAINSVIEKLLSIL